MVLQASNAEEALSLVRTHERIDLLLTDVDMVGGNMNGIELAEITGREKPETKVLVMSGFSASQDLAAEKGMPVLSKPFAAPMLVSRVRELLA